MPAPSRFQTRRRLLRSLPDPEPEQVPVGNWFATPLGQKVLETGRALTAPILERLFGYHILQIGCSDQYSLISDSPVGHKILFSPQLHPGARQAVALNEELPLPSDSMDVVLIHHALDFSDNSHRLLREAARVLRPGGRLLILGFNPIGSWGLVRIFRRTCQAPWNARFLASNRVTDWLELLELYVESTTYGGHYLPLNYAGLLRRSEKWDHFCSGLNIPGGGVYLVLSTKQVAPLSPIVPRWRPLRAPAKIISAAENVRARIH